MRHVEKPETFPEHIAELWRLNELLKTTPTAMSPEDLRSLSAELHWLRVLTSSNTP